MAGTSDNTSRCGRWDFSELRTHAVHAHEHEWSGSSCCRKRLPQSWAPDVEAVLRKRSVQLLIVLTADSRNATRALTLANIAAFSQLNEVRAHFVAVVGRCNDWNSVGSAAATLGVPFECVARPAETSDNGSAADTQFRPKLPLQLLGAQRHMARLRSRTDADAIGMPKAHSEPPFDAIWLPDADIAFSADTISAFLVRWACAFEGGSPLVAQPAMHHDVSRTGRSQQFWPLNYGREWQPGGRLASVGAYAMHTAYVEQQAPLLDAPFFAWFADELGGPLAAMQAAHGTDVGTDQLWCRAAAHYEQQRRRAASQQQPAEQAAARPSCAVIPTPFRHRGMQRRRSPAFWRGVGLVREAAERRWPQYWLREALLQFYRLSSAHVESSKSLGADVCMVRRVSSTRLGAACGGGAAHGSAG